MYNLVKKINKSFSGLYFLFEYSVKAVLRYSLNFSSEFVYSKGANNEKIIHVLGNGPSLNKSLKMIKDEDDVIMVNYSPLSSVFFSIKPKYLCLSDHSFFEKTTMEEDEKRKKEMFELLKKVSWNLNIVIPTYLKSKAPKIVNEKVRFKYVNTVPLNWDVNTFRFFLYKKNLSIPWLHNVMIMGLYVALQKGYKKILLHGVDSDFFKRIEINENNEILVVDDHFYDSEKRNLNKEAFHGFTKGKLYKLLSDQSVMFRSFVDIENYSKYLGSSIINVSPGSMIDAFERERNLK